MARGRGNVDVHVRSTFDERGARQAENALTRLNKTGSASLGTLTKHALGYGAAMIGGAGIVGGLEATVHASIAAEKSQASLDAQLKAVGISFVTHKKEIEDVLAKTSQYSGFLDKDLEGALGNIVRSTGDLGKSYKLLGLATDVARAKNIDVAAAGQMVGRVYAGNTRVLKSLGIVLDPVTKAQDALKASTSKATDQQKRAAKEADKTATSQKALGLLQQKLGGQAKAYGDTTAGSMDKFHAAVDRLQVKLGAALAPTIKDVADKAAKFVTQMQTGEGAGGRFAAKMKQVAHEVGQVLGVVKDVAKWLGQHPQLLAAAGAAWVTYKVAAVAQIAIVRAASLGLFGAGMKTKLAKEAESAGTTAGKSFAAKAGLAAAAGIAGWEVGKWLRQHSGAFRDAGNFLGNNLAEAFGGASTTAQQKVDAAIGQRQDAQNKARSKANANPPSPGHGGIGGRTGRGESNPKSPGHGGRKHAATTSSVVARASTVIGGGTIAHAAGAGSVTGDIAGLNADFLNRLRAMSSGTGHAISVGSGFRTAAEQQALVNQKGVWSQSNPTGAAPVGSSMHEKGLAADISPDRGTFGSVCSQYGIVFPIAAEPWHCQPTGTASSTSAARTTTTTRAAAGPKPLSVYDRLQNVLSHDDLLVSAGIVSDTRGNQMKAQAIRRALPNLRGDNRLQALSNLRQLPKASKPKPFKPTVDKTLQNPWLQAALDHIDRMVAAGQMTAAEGDAAKTRILTNALPQLSGEDALTAQGMIQSYQPATPGDTAVADEQARLDEIDKHVRAGDITAEEGRQQKIASIDDALANWQGLSDSARLELRAQRGDLTKENTAAVQDNTAALQAVKVELEKQNKFAESVTAVSLQQVWGAVADLVSGQIAGIGYSGRALTAGSGSVTRY